MDPQEEQIENKTNFFQAVENAAPNQLDVETTTHGDVQMNVVNAVNANGVVSGRKVVDFIWQRIAICAMIISVGCLAAVIVMVVIANLFNGNVIRLEAEKKAETEKLDVIYEALGVDSQSGAIVALGRNEMLSGEDIVQIKKLISQKYGAVTTWDTTDSSINLVKTNGIYKVVSLKLTNAAGSMRAVVYARLADNSWKVAAYNFADDKNPCKDISDEEKAAISGILECPKETESEAAKEQE